MALSTSTASSTFLTDDTTYIPILNATNATATNLTDPITVVSTTDLGSWPTESVVTTNGSILTFPVSTSTASSSDVPTYTASDYNYTDNTPAVNNVQQLAIIIGVTVGCSIILGLLIWWLCCCCRKRKKKKLAKADEEKNRGDQYIEVVEAVPFCERCGGHSGSRHEEMEERPPLLNPFASTEGIERYGEDGSSINTEDPPPLLPPRPQQHQQRKPVAPPVPPRRKESTSDSSSSGIGSGSTDSDTTSLGGDISIMAPSCTSSERRAMRQLTIPESWRRQSARVEMTLEQKRAQEKFLIMPEPPYSSEAVKTALGLRPPPAKS